MTDNIPAKPQRYRGLTRRLAQMLREIGIGEHHLPRRPMMDDLGIFSESSLRASLVLLEEAGAIRWERNDTRKGRTAVAFEALEEEERKELSEQHRIKSGVITVVIEDSELLDQIARTGYGQ